MDSSNPQLLRVVGLLRQGRRTEALRVAKRLMKTDLSAPTLSNLGSFFSLCQRHTEALQCFHRAVAREGQNGHYLYNLATAQRAIGDLAGAEVSCERAIQANPRDSQALYLRSDLRTQTAQSNHVAELESQLGADIATVQDRTLICFALAKELEDIGEYERAFQHLRAGAAAYRGTLQYDVNNDISVIDAIIETHTAAALRSVAGGYDKAAPVFVVGMPRSGTTLVERIIGSHNDVVSVGERSDFALEMTRLARRGAAQTGRNALVRQALTIDMAELGRSYIERVSADDAGSRRTLDKMPINYLYCGLIHASLPRARIISVRRDPMDSCYAAFKAFLTGPYGFTYDLDELGRYYLAYRRLVDHWRSTLPAEAYVEVSYESIVENVDAVARRMLEFLGLPWQDQVARFFENAAPSSTASAVQVRRPLYDTSIGKWRHYRDQLLPLAQRLGTTGH
jgi:tetratricopeptide (TPR) repeat protein